MAEDRLTGSDKRALVLWVVLGIVGAVFAHRYFFRAFPEASVDFKVSRNEALARARAFVGGLGENISGYQSAIVFDVDDNAKTYLEREVGLQQANRLMSSELNIWYWDVRFFRPQQEEEFRVRVSPGGEIVGYEHKIPEAQAGATLGRAAAETAAQNFLRGKMGVDLGKWDFLSEEANSSKKPNRLDWSFTWEKHGFKAKDAPYRLRATLQGDHPGSSQEFLHVPESWERSYEHLRSTNIFYNQVAIIPYLLLMGSALWLGILLTKRGETGWGLAIKLGVVVAILLTFMQLNNWPLDRMGYDTNSAYGSFVFEEIVKALLFGIGSALTISLILPGAEPLYRASQPARIAAWEIADAARTAVERVFLGGYRGIVARGGAYRVHRGVLYCGGALRGVGAAGFELRKLREHDVSVDFRDRHRLAGGYERRISLSAVRHSLLKATDGIEHCCGDCAGILLELFTLCVSERAAVHSRIGSRADRNRSRHRDAALGHHGDADLALHGGCFAGWVAADSFE